jgi:hypothetical protein
MNAITEWAALPATEMLLRDFVHDSDFSAFMAIWFYEKQKHAPVLMEDLRRFKPEFMPTEEELHAIRFPFDPAPPMETLMLHFCGDVRLTQWYTCASQWQTEPVIGFIYETISRDETRDAPPVAELARQGKLYRVVRDPFYLPEAVPQLAAWVPDLEHTSGETRAAGFPDRSGLSRKRAIQVRAVFDRVGYTRRVREARRPRNPGRFGGEAQRV